MSAATSPGVFPSAKYIKYVMFKFGVMVDTNMQHAFVTLEVQYSKWFLKETVGQMLHKNKEKEDELIQAGESQCDMTKSKNIIIQ